MAKHRSKSAFPVGSGTAQRLAVAAFCALIAAGSNAHAQTAATAAGYGANVNGGSQASGSPLTFGDASGSTTTATPGTDVATADATTGTGAPAPSADGSDANDPNLLDTAELEDLKRQNLREGSVDNLKTASTPKEDDDGISLGTMRLRTSLTQSYGYEQQKTDAEDHKRHYLETEMKGMLTSDWSRHQLTISGDGVWQKNLSGDLEESPSASLDAELRLDLSNDTAVSLKAGYDFSREDTNDPNAIDGASAQSGVHTFSTGISASRNLGVLRGTAGIDLSRTIYTAAKLSDGTSLSQRDRDANTVTGTARLGYELSPALIPFIEASVGRTIYDQTTDSSG